jgi:alpha-tubulin suppressor-like RCC1 family protein
MRISSLIVCFGLTCMGGNVHADANLPRPGKVVAWGCNDFGQCNVPQDLGNVVAVAGGSMHSMALKSDGTVVAWGDNTYGQTDVPRGLNGVVSIASGLYHCLALKGDGTLVGWGWNPYHQTEAPAGVEPLQQISAGYAFTTALGMDGRVSAWGHGDGFLNSDGNPPDLTNVKAVAAGYMSGLALKQDGTVVGWGYNGGHQRDSLASWNNVIAIAAGAYHNLGLLADGTVIGSGFTTVPPGLNSVRQIAANVQISAAIRENGELVIWGEGRGDGNCGVAQVPANIGRVIGVGLGEWHVLAIVSDCESGASIMTPESLVLEASGSGGAIATFDVAAMDASGQPAPVTVKPPSGSVFALGSTAVTVTALDACGNAVSKEFVVRVVDTTAPRIEGLHDIIVPCSADRFVPVDFQIARALDIVDASPSISYRAIGAGNGLFGVGTTLVEVTSTDNAGNSSSGTFRVIRASLGFTGFENPVGGADDTGGSIANPVRTFKLGSTIPVKFSLNCDGSPVVNGRHTIAAYKYSDATTGDAPVAVIMDETASDSNEFVLSDGRWRYNLDTKKVGMSSGIWKLDARISDGSTHSVWIQLKK